MITTLALLAAAAATSGGCAAVFEEVAAATEANYAGHVIKLPDDEARASYGQFRTMLAERAGRADGHAACREVLQVYVGFFGDHHLFVLGRDNAASPIPPLHEAWTEALARKYFGASAGATDPMEGFWFDADGSIAIVRDAALAPGQYVAVRLDGEAPGTAIALVQRHPGGYRIGYRHSKWGWQEADASLHRGGELLGFDTNGWGRAGAAYMDVRDPMAPVFADLGDGVLYLSMPSFMESYRQPLQQIMAAHGEAIASARGLVVDIRGNAGGNAIYFDLAPYFLANDIRISEPSSVLASPWTVEHFEGMRRNMGGNGAFLDGALQAMRERPGTIVDYLDGSVDGLPSYPPKPERVVVLQDRGVGSAAEAFVYHARQSTKVVTMGEPTRGNIDYMGVSMHEVGDGDHRFWFGYPTYFRRDLPDGSVDDVGYTPDVRLALPPQQWLPFAKEWIIGTR